MTGLPDEDAVTAQYWRLAAPGRATAGFEHYEISNYARPGRRSAPQPASTGGAEEYLGLGPGACGFLGDVRYGNVKPVERYCAAPRARAPARSTLTSA